MYTRQYSLSKGIAKGITSALTIAASLAVFAGLSDVTLWDLVVTYVKPVLGSLTVGGLITVALNWVKFHTSE